MEQQEKKSVAERNPPLSSEEGWADVKLPTDEDWNRVVIPFIVGMKEVEELCDASNSYESLVKSLCNEGGKEYLLIKVYEEVLVRQFVHLLKRLKVKGIGYPKHERISATLRVIRKLAEKENRYPLSIGYELSYVDPCADWSLITFTRIAEVNGKPSKVFLSVQGDWPVDIPTFTYVIDGKKQYEMIIHSGYLLLGKPVTLDDLVDFFTNPDQTSILRHKENIREVD